jgi:hypothetical protein
MPRINIHEVDNTKPGSRAYSNFTVVVPGFHAPYFDEKTDDATLAEANGIILQKKIERLDADKNLVEDVQALTDEDVFGDAGILEIKTQADFAQFIGHVKPQRIDEGFSTLYVNKLVLASDTNGYPTIIRYYNGSEIKNNMKVSDLDIIVEQDKENNFITFILNVEGEKAEIKYDYVMNEAGELELTPIQPAPATPDTGATVAEGAETNGEDGGEETPTTPIVGEATVRINSDQEIVACEFTYNGTHYEKTFEYDAEVRLPAHYGNQIAWELLGLGYTVLYVNMGEFYSTKKAKKDQYGKPMVDPETGAYIKPDITTPSTDIINVGYNAIHTAFKNLGTEDFWANLRDKTTYDFRFVLAGFIEDGNGFFDYMKNASYEISKLAAWEAPGEDAFAHVRARGDCLALVDLDEVLIRDTIVSSTSGLGNTTKRTIQAIQKELGRQNFGSYGKYSAVFTPSVTYTNNTNIDVYQNSQFPASFHYLACFAKSVFTNNFKEWFAVAGFNRGNSIYNISSTAFKLGDIAVQALEPRFEIKGSGVKVAVNVIVNNRGSYYIWGNRTAHDLGEELVASHFLNIRQLCITLKKFIYTQCRKFTFDPNSDLLWTNFVNGLTPLLENMKANQGIREYAIEKVPTSLKGVLSAKVRIIPIEAVEDFEITVALEDSFNGTTATVSE